jgi:protein-arginine kinase activator protein McsA
MPYKDASVRKLKHAEYSREYYLANKEKVIARSKVTRALGKAKWDTFKRTLKCTKCEQNHPAALDFHHTDPSEKENIVSNLVSQGSFVAAMEEVQKCIVLCANCHRIHHAEEKQNPAF